MKEKLVRVNPDGYLYQFTDEDFYIYMVAHAYKHYSIGGTGLRTLIDFYLFLNQKESSMNWGYITEEIKKLFIYRNENVSEFEQQIRSTSKKVFLPKAELNADDRNMIEFMFGSGTYGTVENVIKWRAGFLHADSKGKYLFRRIFPPMEHYKMYFPTAAKHPVLIPFVWVFCLVRAVTVRKSWYTSEISNLKNTSEKEFQL